MKMKMTAAAAASLCLLAACANMQPGQLAGGGASAPQPSRVEVPLATPLFLQLDSGTAKSRIGMIADVYLSAPAAGAASYGTARMWVTYLDDQQKTGWVDSGSVAQAHYPHGIANREIEITLADGKVIRTSRMEMFACPSETIPLASAKGCQPMTLTGKGDKSQSVTYFTAHVSDSPTTLYFARSKDWTNYVRLLADMTDRGTKPDVDRELSIEFLDKAQQKRIDEADAQARKEQNAQAVKRQAEATRQLNAKADQARAKLRAQPRGTTLLCDTGRFALSAGKPITSISYQCYLTGTDMWWNVRDVLNLGWRLSSQTRTPVDTYEGGPAYDVSLVFTKN